MVLSDDSEDPVHTTARATILEVPMHHVLGLLATKLEAENASEIGVAEDIVERQRDGSRDRACHTHAQVTGSTR